jgi:hypothetical protein
MLILLCRDSHTKTFYRALQCFMLDFWENQAECESNSDASAVAQLQKLPVRPGDSQCIHLRGPSGGRICIVHVVLGSSLVNNKQVSCDDTQLILYPCSQQTVVALLVKQNICCRGPRLCPCLGHFFALLQQGSLGSDPP